MKDQVSNEIEKFEDEVEESEKQIADAMKKLNAEKTGKKTIKRKLLFRSYHIYAFEFSVSLSEKSIRLIH